MRDAAQDAKYLKQFDGLNADIALHWIARASAAESEVVRLREACETAVFAFKAQQDPNARRFNRQKVIDKLEEALSPAERTT